MAGAGVFLQKHIQKKKASMSKEGGKNSEKSIFKIRYMKRARELLPEQKAWGINYKIKYKKSEKKENATEKKKEL